MNFTGKLWLIVLAQILWAGSFVEGAEIQSEAAPVTLNEVLVSASAEKNINLPEVDGAKIYTGKKTALIDLQETPTIINNNYRQALQKTPGLLLSEESTPLISIGYRGLDPNRAQFTQVLKDGIPIHADMLGYPEAYYTPPLQTIDHIDFIKGGGSLLYGPQPGGALNFVTKDPYADAPFYVETENSGGSHGLFSHYTGLSGTSADWGYYGYLHHRQSQGFRNNNSQSQVYSGGAKLRYTQDDTRAWTVNVDAYNEEHGEPGGLTRADFDADIAKTNRLNDHFELNRYAGSVAYEQDIDDTNAFSWKAFGGYYERLSWRQRTSVSSFGIAPNLNSNDIESQEFYTAGTEARVRKDYAALGSENNTFTSGILYYHVTSPRVDKRGNRADAEEGTVRKDADRIANYVSLFAENAFRFGKFSVVPGVRLENIWQGVTENINLDKTTVPLADESTFDFVPLAGLGLGYELTETVDLYSNISQAYRPKIFSQAVPTGSGQVVNNDLEEGKAWQADVGMKGSLNAFTTWDTSVFYMEFKDQIGTSGTTVDNVGDATHYGVEIAGEVNLLSWWDELNQTQTTQEWGDLNWFANAMLLHAEFDEGPNEGKTPQYAPDYIFKTGMEYNYQNRLKLRLAGTFLDDHFANDTNTASFTVPSYKVWDLTGEMQIYKESVSLFGGINNLFDEHYFARVRNDGIDPADGRNYYGGLKIRW